MARYTDRWSELGRESTELRDQELTQLAKYLHSSKLDPEFDPDDPVYTLASGDPWLSLPQLTDRQLSLITVILSSSTVEFENTPLRSAAQTLAEHSEPALDL